MHRTRFLIKVSRWWLSYAIAKHRGNWKTSRKKSQGISPPASRSNPGNASGLPRSSDVASALTRKDTLMLALVSSIPDSVNRNYEALSPLPRQGIIDGFLPVCKAQKKSKSSKRNKLYRKLNMPLQLTSRPESVPAALANGRASTAPSQWPAVKESGRLHQTRAHAPPSQRDTALAPSERGLKGDVSPTTLVYPPSLRLLAEL
ncbi:unnamed protein product [Rangifer tarandus platyrhynchus]|uniref:Uncharacterized protein n=2 Tax=Rangifer tarandus platyrhynchus TaxID=3082113 RepID=A0ACB0ETN4_RANTA|nr:unnamed protein product [Rangifer tarandus platyrhynchus]CAI9703707.1 unnamed protein product [Rangifer tarandus platyrhynchus]